MTISNQQVEHVLVAPTLLFREIGYFQGFCDNPKPYLNTLFDPSYTSYQPRDAVEEDPSYKQLIPYCIFRCNGQIFSYTRGKMQGEQRLHNKRSIGIGGHISSDDAKAVSPYQEGMWREIEEEVFLDSPYQESCVGLINDDKTDVGQVHLGIVHIFELEEPKVQPREESIIQSGFADPADYVDRIEEFETWSQICLRSLILQ